MKDLFFLVRYSLWIVIAILFITCKDEDELCNQDCPENKCIAKPAPLYHPGEMIKGRVAGLKNCLPFVASAQAFIFDDTSKLVGLEIKTFIDRGSYYTDKEIIAIGIKADAVGLWSFIEDPDYHSYRTMDDIDVIEDLYMIDLNYSNNVMQIDTLDKINQSISGWFQCRFIIAYPQNASGNNPDTVIFNDCHFIAEE